MKLTKRIRILFTFYFWTFLLLAALVYFQVLDKQSNFINQQILSFFALQSDQIKVLEWQIVLAVSTLAALLPSLFFLKVKIRRTPTLITFAVCVFIIAAVGVLVTQKILIPVLYVGIAVAVGTFGGMILKMIFASSETEFLRRAFSQFVSENMLKELLRNPEKLKLTGKEVEITVMFLDIRGFTSYSEKHPPAEVVLRLNSLLDKVTTIILAHDGTVDKYMGDAVMAMWGAPNPDRNQTQKACLAAIDIQKKLAKETHFKVGIGINYGQAIVGNIGSSKRFDYTAIGDTVNTAARLESATKELKVPIVISKSVKEKLEAEWADITTFDLGEISIKGKAEKVKVYKLE